MTGPAGPDRGVPLVVRDAARGDLDQHLADHRRGIGRFFVDQPADAGWFLDADGLHRWFLSCADAVVVAGTGPRCRTPPGPPPSPAAFRRATRAARLAPARLASRGPQPTGRRPGGAPRTPAPAPRPGPATAILDHADQRAFPCQPCERAQHGQPYSDITSGFIA